MADRDLGYFLRGNLRNAFIDNAHQNFIFITVFSNNPHRFFLRQVRQYRQSLIPRFLQQRCHHVDILCHKVALSAVQKFHTFLCRSAFYNLKLRIICLDIIFQCRITLRDCKNILILCISGCIVHPLPADKRHFPCVYDIWYQIIRFCECRIFDYDTSHQICRMFFKIIYHTLTTFQHRVLQIQAAALPDPTHKINNDPFDFSVVIFHWKRWSVIDKRYIHLFLCPNIFNFFSCKCKPHGRSISIILLVQFT